jgi:hypothetical protein
MKKIQPLLFSLVLVVGLFLGFIWGQSTQIATPAATPNGAFSLMIDSGDGEITTYPDVSLAKDRNLFNLMRKAIQEDNKMFEYEEYRDLGILITKIGDKKNGTGNRYWQYWVNNRFAPVAASSYVVQDGDIIEWKFIPQKFYE